MYIWQTHGNTVVVMETSDSMDEANIPMEVLNMEGLDMTVEDSGMKIIIDADGHVVDQGNGK